MQIKDIVAAFLKRKQQQLMERYSALEDIQREHPEIYSAFQRKMDKIDKNADLIRRMMFELDEQM